MNQQLMDTLRQIVKDEKFKLDAYFLCGATASPPNQPLQKACENYLAAAEAGADTAPAKAELIAQLEKAVNAKPTMALLGDMSDNRADILKVWESRDQL